MNPSSKPADPDDNPSLDDQVKDRERLRKHLEWERRSEQLREQEWEVAQKLLAAAGVTLRQLMQRRKIDASFFQVARMLDLASKIGRLSTGLANNREEFSGPDGGPLLVRFQESLRRIYGKKAVIDVTPSDSQLSTKTPQP